MRSFRGVPCPKCQRKGLGYAPHPHAYGWKDYGQAYCRFCRAFFPVTAVPSEPHTIGTDPPTPENDPVGRFRKPKT